MIVSKISRFAAAVLSFLFAANGITASAQGNNGPPGNGSCSMTIPFCVDDDTGRIPEGTVFTVELRAVDNGPLPEKTSFEVDVSGEFEFGPVIFDEPNSYEYIVSEVVYDDDTIIFDTTVYHVHAAVLYNEEGELVCGYSLSKEGSDAKPDQVRFCNRSTLPPDDSSEPDSSGPAEDSSEPGPPQEDSSDISSGKTDGDSINPPHTGGAVTIGFTAVVSVGLPLLLIFRRKQKDDEKPPDNGTG